MRVTPSLLALAAAGYLIASGCATQTADGHCGHMALASGERALFDGTRESLAEWRMAGPGGFEHQEDCSIRTVGGMGLLWFPEELTEYRLTVEWRTSGDDNSGVFVGFPEPGDDPWVAVEQGYEIQIDGTDAPDRTTGAIYGFQGADVSARDTALNTPGEWNTFDIAVEAQGVTVYLNDTVVNEFASNDPGRDLTSGYIGLQNHGDDDEVYFRSIILGPPD